MLWCWVYKIMHLTVYFLQHFDLADVQHSWSLLEWRAVEVFLLVISIAPAIVLSVFLCLFMVHCVMFGVCFYLLTTWQIKLYITLQSAMLKICRFLSIIYPTHTFFKYASYCLCNSCNCYHYVELQPHRGQSPCCGGGILHRWPERFLKSEGEELTKRWPKRESRWLHITGAFVLVSAPQPTTASQPSIYGFTVVCLRLHKGSVYGFIAATCNLVVTFGDVHWAELIWSQRWAGVRACPPRR